MAAEAKKEATEQRKISAFQKEESVRLTFEVAEMAEAAANAKREATEEKARLVAEKGQLSMQTARAQMKKVVKREVALRAQIKEAEEASRQAADKAEQFEKAFKVQKELAENKCEEADEKRIEALTQQEKLDSYESMLLDAGRVLMDAVNLKKCSIM
jgi:isoleucyl-tRNA synthetase